MASSANYKVAFLLLVSLLCGAYAEEALSCAEVDPKLHSCIYRLRMYTGEVVYRWNSGPQRCSDSLGRQIRCSISMVEKRGESTQQCCSLVWKASRLACICLKDIGTKTCGSYLVDLPFEPSNNCSSVA